MNRFRIHFSKNDSMRFTSNLDVMRTWERIFRRAKLPIAYSQGFNPHPKFNLAAPLPLGFTSEAEVLDVWFEKDLQPDFIQESIEKTLPPGITINHIEPIDNNTPKIQKSLVAAEYEIRIGELPSGLESRIAALLKESTIMRIRRGKKYDLRPLILEIRLDDEPAKAKGITILLKAKPNATGRPDEVLHALEIDPLETHIHRKRLLFNT